MIILILFFALVSSPAESSSRFQINCEVNGLVYDFAKHILQNHATGLKDRLPYVYSALQLDSCSPKRSETHATYQSERAYHSGHVDVSKFEHLLYIDPLRGSDKAHGSIREPLRSVEKAVSLSREKGLKTGLILRGGIYFLSSTLLLDERDDGLSIINFPGEEPIISGGQKLDLSWQPWTCGVNKDKISNEQLLNQSCWSANVPESIRKNDFSQLFLDGNRAIRARHPNAGWNDSRDRN